ncbi:hypothetical protein [Sphingobium lignivorans]|uniref:Deoxyxylulose-5-phosphate synthase n=1 Tax=Sphingobium lignivorans TaxID=2735886 RepID=A0ABR6NHK7_9SPHN|nr:hypothetical protein [Sphingobium lignivorans]MBB5986003.1 deoxyxylulose-5-phosphate synthase [Sphingobium lignivorans]
MFTVEYHSGGLLRQTHNGVPAYKHRSMARIPDFSVLAPSLAPTVRQALQRASWDIECADMLRC